MSANKLPLVILAGRDRAPPVLPEAGRNLHALRGYKAMDLIIGGRPLIGNLVGRLRQSDRFDPIFVAGPVAVYRKLGGQVRLVDTDSDFGGNIRAGVEAARAQCPPGMLAFITGDVLPELADLREALEDFDRHQPVDFWVPECRVPDDITRLGASAWKPTYLIQPEGEDAPVATLPGHLMIVDPQALRLDLVYRLFELAYRTRNRPQSYRRSVMVRSILAIMLARDLRRLVTLRLPNITWGMLWNGIVLAHKLVTVGCRQSEMAERLYRIWVRNSHRRRFPRRRGRVVVLEGLSLAKDIDTEEEAREIAELEEPANLNLPV